MLPSEPENALVKGATTDQSGHAPGPCSLATSHTRLRSSLVSVGVGSTVFLVGLMLVPSRQRFAQLDWYKVSGDAARYLEMMSGHPQPYPWGGRWVVPTVAAYLPGDQIATLRLVNYACLWGALICLSALGLNAIKRTRISAVALAWIFSSTGVGLLLCFQNPLLTDSALLLCISAIGLLRMKGNWWGVSFLIPVSVGVRESAIVFVLLLFLAKKWRFAVPTVVASLAMLMYSRSLSKGIQVELPELNARLIFKLYMGLGSVWIIMASLAILFIRRRLFTREYLSNHRAAFDFYFVATIGGLVALPLATDVPRLCVFLLPVTFPLSTWFIAHTRDLSVSAVASIAAVPAIFVVVPTSFFRNLLPNVMPDLDQYYFANLMLLAASIILATAAACYVSLASFRDSSRLSEVDLDRW